MDYFQIEAVKQGKKYRPIFIAFWHLSIYPLYETSKDSRTTFDSTCPLKKYKRNDSEASSAISRLTETRKLGFVKIVKLPIHYKDTAHLTCQVILSRLVIKALKLLISFNWHETEAGRQGPRYPTISELWGFEPRSKRHRDTHSQAFHTNNFAIPMRSANPPTGNRHVPVTNCSSLILFSLSISFTNWKRMHF